MASPGLSDLITSTLRDRSDSIADNVTGHNALLSRINKAGNRRPATGRTIVEPIDFSANTTVAMYSNFDTIDTTPSNPLTAAEYDWRQMSGSVVMSGLERVKNAGESEIIDLLESRIINLEREMENELASQLYKDGTTATDFGGLQLLVGDDPTAGSPGGISASTYAWWQNQEYDYSDQSATASSTTVQTAMNDLYLNCIRGNDAPDTWVADKTYFGHYWSSLQTIQRLTSEEKGAAGFRSIEFLGSDVFYDNNCPSTRMYALNTDYLKLRYSPEENFVPGEPRIPYNQNAVIVPVFFSGNLTCSNRARQGLIQP
jgi:hypothetical protein